MSTTEENIVMSPKNLFIGLGGSGLTMIRALRCIISRELEYKSIHGPFTSPDQAVPHHIQIRYLEVDSSATDLKSSFVGSHPISGPTLQLGDEYQFCIQASDIQGAAQSRLRGAELFLAHAPMFDQKITEMVNAVDGASGCNIHICAGLAGGTGSGSIVDAVCRIRQLFPHQRDGASKIKLFLYLYLPINGFEGAMKFYHANGYAALAELSALNTRRWTPKDKAPGKGTPYQFDADVTPEHEILAPVFNSCYLFDIPTAPKGAGCSNPMNDRMAQLFGYFLYEKLFVWPRAEEKKEAIGHINKLKRADLNENLDEYQFEFAYDMDENAIKESANKKTTDTLRRKGCRNRMKQEFAIHSNRFQTVGLKRLIVPRLEINNHYAAVLANEGLLQLRYNKPSNSGFIDLEANNDTPEKQKEFQNKLREQQEEIKLAIINNKRKEWALDDDGAITFQKKVLENDPVEEITKNWESYIETKYKALYIDKDWRNWCDALKMSLQKHYRQNFHRIPGQAATEGVEEYYDNLANQIPVRAQAHINLWVKERFIKRLFSSAEGKDERCSLLDMDQTAKALYTALTDKQGIIERVGNAINDFDKKIARYNKEAQELLEKFHSLSWISGPIHKKPYFQTYKEKLCALYVTRTRKCAYEYAKKYLAALADETENLKNTTTAILAGFDETLRGVYKKGSAALAVEGIQSIIRDNCPSNHNIRESLKKDISVKVYNFASIQANDKELKSKDTYTKVYLGEIRRTMRTALEAGGQQLENVTLTELLNYFKSVDFRQSLMSVCKDTVTAHKDFKFTQEFKINKAIQDTYKGEEQRDLANIINNTSQLALSTSTEELTMVPESNTQLASTIKKVKVGFLSKVAIDLVPELEDSLKTHMGEDDKLINLDAETEILITRITNGLPPRAFSRVRELYAAFRKLEDQSDVYTDEKAPFPQFFPSKEEICDLYRGYHSTPEKEFVGELADITDTDYGSLLKRYLIGKVFCKEDDNKMYWGTSKTDGENTWRRLYPKMNDCFLIEDYLAAVKSNVEQAMTTGQKSFTLLHLYREMKQTEEEWQSLVNPKKKTDKTLAPRRAEALARLDELVNGMKAEFPETSEEYTHALLIHKWYGEKLGREQ